MNTERLAVLAEWLEKGAPHERITFDMCRGIGFSISLASVYYHALNGNPANACKTSCCIAGSAVQFFGDVAELVAKLDEYEVFCFENNMPFDDVHNAAAELLGLDEDQSYYLFTPHIEETEHPYDSLAYYDKPAWAARVIRNLIATGIVDWRACE